MVVLLHLVAIAMIAIGGAAMLFGSEVAAIERGWAMLIAGSIGASAGAVLLGLATVARIVRRMQADLATIRVAADLASEQARLQPIPLEEARPARAPIDTVAQVGLRGPIEPHAPAAAVTPAWTDTASIPAAETVAVPVAPPAEPAPQPPEPAPPPVVSRAERTGTPVETITKVRDRVFVREVSVEPESRPVPAMPVSAPVPPPPPEPPSMAEIPAPEASTEPVLAPDRKVIGQYSSGGNAYIMYADGSIEADTPSGRYLFGSLDELKAFVSVGGENEAKAAAGLSGARSSHQPLSADRIANA